MSMDDFTELEAELKQLKPRRPAPSLERRLAGELDRRRPWLAAWTALPVAAALVAALVLARPGARLTQHPLEEGVYKPVSAEGVRYQSNDEGMTTLADGTPARQVRDSYVETITWENPATKASLRWTVPYDEVRVVPIDYQ